MHFSNLQDREAAQLVTYEYIFFLMAEWSATRFNQSPTAFSDSNDLGTSKLLLYPFFFATANGHSKDLFELMGPFYAQQDGPMPRRLLEASFNPNAPFKFFKLDFQQNDKFGITINSSNEYISWKSLEEKILNTEVGGVFFKNLMVKANEPEDPLLFSGAPNETSIFLALKSSFKVIHQLDPKFIELSSTGLARICSYYRSFRYYLEVEPENPMKFEYVQKDRRAYA